METSTKRSVNVGAEKFLFKEISVLSKGSVSLVDYMGNDESVVAAARVSYDKGVGDEEGNKRLINFLMRERHTSPFEHCILTFDIKAPIFVMRELVRHRTARMNEISGRYTELPAEYYVPEQDRVQKQSTTNKQGSGEPLDRLAQELFILNITRDCDETFSNYQGHLADGVARELARISLPLNTYSRVRWQCDLHNLLHFLKLRMSPTAQWEIRQYANEIARVVQDSFPKVWAAFDEYVLNAVSLSRTERQMLTKLLEGYTFGSKETDKLIRKIQGAA